MFMMQPGEAPAEQPAWMAHAWRELDQSERAGSRHNPRILQLYRDAGHPEIDRDEVAWCAAFVGACFERAGLRSTRSLMARSYLAWGTSSDRGQPGCVAVFSRGSDPASGHVGFWVGEADNSVYVLGGTRATASAWPQ